MIRRRTILLLVLLMISTGLFAESKLGFHKQSWGMVFQIQALTGPVNNDTDGAIAGLGVRYWLFDQFVVRAIAYFNFNYATATDETAVRTGLSLGCEYHFIKGVVSPYAGVLAGLETWVNPDGTDFHFGALVGVELTPLEFLSFFLEYSVLATFRETGTEIDLGYNHAPVFGVNIYLN